MMEKLALACEGENWEEHAHPLSLYYHHVQSCSVRSSGEGRYGTPHVFFISSLIRMNSIGVIGRNVVLVVLPRPEHPDDPRWGTWGPAASWRPTWTPPCSSGQSPGKRTGLQNILVLWLQGPLICSPVYHKCSDMQEKAVRIRLLNFHNFRCQDKRYKKNLKTKLRIPGPHFFLQIRIRP